MTDGKLQNSGFLSKNRRILLVLLDSLAILASYILTWVLISGRANLDSYRSMLYASTILFLVSYIAIFTIMGMYDSLWRYAEIYEFFRCVVASALSIILFISLTLIIFRERRIPLSVYMMSAMFASTLTLYIRLAYRMFRNTTIRDMGRKRSRVLVIGAGDAASTLLHEIFKNPSKDYNVICAVDDNPDKVGRAIMGVKIMGQTKDIPTLVTQCGIDTLLLAIPTLEEEDKRRILGICAKTKCNLRLLPDITKMITSGKDLLSRIRDFKVEDMLGRDEVELITRSAAFLKDKVVLVTGAGGSIGSELCRQVAVNGPKKLILVDIYENNAYELQQELKREYGDGLDLEVFIASVRDSKKMNKIFSDNRPQIVFHAAAHKHVPLMEYSPEEAIKNNICGTYNVAQSADKYKAERFVLISTDKAVNPTNIMGATKRVCEMIVQAKNAESETKYMAVRFGNVLGSSGSVIPLFKEQIAKGGPVTVTHPEVVRYFMTITEAVSLVIQAGAMGDGGEVFVLDMGEPVKILDLAENLIRFAGLMPYKDIDIEFTGLRPGEKLYEELLLSEEGIEDTKSEKIFIGHPAPFEQSGFLDDVLELKKTAFANESAKCVQALLKMVPTFKHKADKENYD